MRRISVAIAFVLFVPLCSFAAGAGDFRPDPKSVQRYGPAYRYPQAGWIVLHIEGEPYARGYQHGRLMAPEIAAHVRCFATVQSPRAPSDGWKLTRTLVNALFVRRYDKEYLEEMKGIADGAAAAGARFDNRPVDLVDIVALNSWPEVDTLESALNATATGLEGRRFRHEQPQAKQPPKQMHCSAFAATWPATRKKGEIVFGHITMFSLYPSLFYNVWLDVKPARGYRVLMQTYPGGVQSGMDYYLNEKGLLVCETTIAQTKFDIKGLTVASRIRQALQYADNIDKAVEVLKDANNGLYTNEWLLADTKTGEIAMFELGTHRSKLYRSSKDEWFGGTEGFYWGCNNTKDLDVRMETVADVKGRPANVVFRPSPRDKKWLELYAKYKGKMDADFGKVAFTTPPLAAYHSLDAKFTTTSLANDLKTWALFGPPLGRSWQPAQQERQLFPEVRPLASNPWTILHTQPPARDTGGDVTAADLPARVPSPEVKQARVRRRQREVAEVPAWHGTLLPKTDADVWLATAFADYQAIYAREKAYRRRGGDKGMNDDDRDRLAVDFHGFRSAYLAAARVVGDVPLAKTRSELIRDEWYRIAAGKGVLALHELRKQLGDETFEKAMNSFGRKHAGQPVSTAQFRVHMEKASGQPLTDFFASLDGRVADGKNKGGVYSVLSFTAELENTLIIYGTGDEGAANREAAEGLQRALIERGPNYTVPIKSDKEATEDDLKSHHLLLIGRPDCNRVVDRCRGSLPVTFGSRSFKIRDKSYAHARSAVIVAGENPLNKRYSVVVLAGLSSEATLAVPAVLTRREQPPAEVLLMAHGDEPRSLVVPARDVVRQARNRR
jgi:hypothetical protein